MTKKILKGKIISDKMLNTVIVAVEMPKRHPVYGKLIKNTRKLKAHTTKQLKSGDLVTIQESRPYSKEVTWEVVEQ